MEKARVKKISEFTAVEKVLGNTDLLTIILNLLPPKPLLRSKAVSNHWLTLISDPHFLLNHSRRLHARQPPSSFPQFYYGTEPLSLDDNGEVIPNIDQLEGIGQNVSTNSKLEILNSCNGLMLCHHGFFTPLLLLNPTTNRHRLIPIPYNFFDPERGSIFLIFDPSKSIHYRVLSFKYSPIKRDNSWVIYIFTSESGLWKQILHPTPSNWVDFFTRNVFLRGAIHCLNCRNFHVQFLIEEEKFTWNLMSIDPKILIVSGGYYIAECDNGLLAIKMATVGGNNFSDLNGVFTIFEMNKDSNLWAHKHKLDVRPLLSEFHEMRHIFIMAMVLYVRSEANEETLSMVLEIPEKIILYLVRPEDNLFTAKVLREKPNLERMYGDFHPYIQCLLPL